MPWRISLEENVGQGEAQALTLAVLAKTALRSLFLESSWHQPGQQNMGYASSLAPAVKAIYRERPQALKQVWLRLFAFFNTNPISSGLVIGAALNLEEGLARGEMTPERHRALIGSLSSALAAQGDLIFWQSWLPFCCLAGFALTFIGHFSWGPAVIPILFCLLAWPIRFGGLLVGYRQGLRVFSLVDRYRVRAAIAWIQRLTSLLSGTLTVLALGQAIPSPGQSLNLRPMAFALFMAFSLLAVRYVQAKMPSSRPWLHPAWLVLMVSALFVFVR
jgi:mannose/fructose/N-acetylgalactosamine-specific phosphotransferase system component IID